MAFSNLGKKVPGPVEILPPILVPSTSPQEVVHGINGLQEKGSLQKLTSADPSPEDKEVLPVKLLTRV
jgi:hypothetical protein